MKKILLFMAVALTVCLTACGNKNEAESQVAEEPQVTETEYRYEVDGNKWVLVTQEKGSECHIQYSISTPKDFDAYEGDAVLQSESQMDQTADGKRCEVVVYTYQDSLCPELVIKVAKDRQWATVSSQADSVACSHTLNRSVE